MRDLENNILYSLVKSVPHITNILHRGRQPLAGHKCIISSLVLPPVFLLLYDIFYGLDFFIFLHVVDSFV